ncbi:MAG: GGDEF domain-containing protein, partial [Bacteroidota bacterium]
DEDRLLNVMRRVSKAVSDIAPLFQVQVAEPEELEKIIERCDYAFAHPNGDLPEQARSAPATPAALAESPRVDPLTGLASRSRFDAYLSEQFDFAQQVGKPLSVLLCDPDHFDMVNQTFGREAGDRALAALGTLVGERLRYRDLAARYGGEEFGLILTDTHAGGAAIVAERLRKKIEEAQHEIGIGDPVRMTISVGCVTLDEALGFQTPADLLKAVEQVLAQAKRAGRNRVMSSASVNVTA